MSVYIHPLLPCWPLSRVLLACVGLFLTGVVGMGGLSENIWTGFLLIPLGFFIGPWMGIFFPFDGATRMAYIATLLLAVFLIICGIRFFSRISGQGAVVLGMLLWTLAGLVGLGTGT